MVENNLMTSEQSLEQLCRIHQKNKADPWIIGGGLVLAAVSAGVWDMALYVGQFSDGSLPTAVLSVTAAVVSGVGLYLLAKHTSLAVEQGLKKKTDGSVYYRSGKFIGQCRYISAHNWFDRKWGKRVVAAPVSLEGMKPSEKELVLLNGVTLGDIPLSSRVDSTGKFSQWYDAKQKVDATYNEQPLKLVLRDADYLINVARLGKQLLYILGSVGKDGSIGVLDVGTAFRTS